MNGLNSPPEAALNRQQTAMQRIKSLCRPAQPGIGRDTAIHSIASSAALISSAGSI